MAQLKYYDTATSTWKQAVVGTDGSTYANVVTQSGTSYTLVSADASTLVLTSNASAITVTVPPNSAAPIAVGRTITILQYGAGQVTLAAGVGVTLRTTTTLKTRTQYSLVSVIKIATDEWIVVGDLAVY